MALELKTDSGSDDSTCSAGPLTAEMIREMLGHVPFDVGDMPDRWQWMANYLNETLRDPGVITLRKHSQTTPKIKCKLTRL